MGQDLINKPDFYWPSNRNTQVVVMCAGLGNMSLQDLKPDRTCKALQSVVIKDLEAVSL